MSICKKVQSATHFNSPLRIDCWPEYKKVGTQATQRPLVWYTKLKKREIEV